VVSEPARPLSTEPGADEQLWSALVAVYQTVLRDVVKSLEQDAGIDSGVYSALAYLDRAEVPGCLRLRELQDLMHVRYSQPGLSRLVQRMEADGLVQRRPDPEDGRSVTIVMTRAGRTRFARATDIYRDALHRHLGQHVSPADAARLTRDLDGLAAALR
jgi:DNA-binding MarR family transcriptional regulator